MATGSHITIGAFFYICLICRSLEGGGIWVYIHMYILELSALCPGSEICGSESNSDRWDIIFPDEIQNGG